MSEEIYFSDDKTFDKISEILIKNGLEETLLDAGNKIAETGTSLMTIVFRLSKEFAKKKINEKDFILSLQKQLSVSSQTAENIIKEVKEKILPSAEKITIGVKTQEEKLITANPVRLIKEKQHPDNNKTPSTPEKVIEKKFRPIKDKETQKIPKKSAGSDSYREPIG